MCGEGLEVLLMCCQWQMLASNALAITSQDWPVLYLGDDISQLQCHQREYQGHCLIVFQSVCPSFKVPKLQGKNGEVYVEIYDPLGNYMDPLGPNSLTIIAVRFPSWISRHTTIILKPILDMAAKEDYCSIHFRPVPMIGAVTSICGQIRGYDNRPRKIPGWRNPIFKYVHQMGYPLLSWSMHTNCSPQL